MLLLLQAVAQQLPPTHVIVDQVPAGLSEWARALIAASIGAAFAIIGNIAMEYAKASITKALLRRTMFEQLSAEFLNNLRLLEKAYAIVDDILANERVHGTGAMGLITSMLGSTKFDRFRLYFESQKALLYEIDPASKLEVLFRATTEAIPNAIKEQRFSDVKKFLAMAVRVGCEFFDEHKLQYLASFDIWQDLYESNFKKVPPILEEDSDTHIG